MIGKWHDKQLTYDGSQLRPLYTYLEYGILGDSILGWQGPCDIPTDKIVDGEDLRASSRICGAMMLHFILEIFDQKLATAVLMQRLLVSIAKDLVFEKSGVALVRKGDDLYLDDKKFNISIASQSTVSSMIHIAFNVTNEGTPVETLSLGDLKIEAFDFAKDFLQAAEAEYHSIKRATMKVRPLA